MDERIAHMLRIQDQILAKDCISVEPWLAHKPWPPEGWEMCPKWIKNGGNWFLGHAPGGIAMRFGPLQCSISVNIAECGLHGSFSHPYARVKESTCKEILQVLTGRGFDRFMSLPAVGIGPNQNAVMHFKFPFREGTDDRRIFDAAPRIRCSPPE